MHWKACMSGAITCRMVVWLAGMLHLCCRLHLQLRLLLSRLQELGVCREGGRRNYLFTTALAGPSLPFRGPGNTRASCRCCCCS